MLQPWTSTPGRQSRRRLHLSVYRDDLNHRGIELIPEIVEVYETYGFDTEVLSASIRSPLHVTEAALAGSHVATIPYKVYKQLFKHPLTDIGLEKFLADHQKANA